MTSQGDEVDAIKVSIPARPDFVHILRSVIASVAAVLNFPYDGIDDLRIAVDEACAHLLAVPASPTSLVVEIVPSDEGIEAVVSIDAGSLDWPPPGARDTLTWQVLNALADRAQFEKGQRGPAIRFTKHLPS